MTANRIYDDNVHIENRKRRNLCRIVVSPSFYVSCRKRFDIIVIKNSKDHVYEVPQNMFTVWLSKAISFIRTTFNDIQVLSKHAKNLDRQKFQKKTNQHNFVLCSNLKFYVNPKLKLDKVNSSFACTRLRKPHTAR